MYSTSVAEKAMSMRPGIISGPYPERRNMKKGRIDSSLEALWGSLDKLRGHQATGCPDVVSTINRLENALTNRNTEALSRLAIPLRHRLRSQGLNPLLCVRAFALIRELSARTLGLRHYDSQLIGSWIVLQGQLAEMETGEGKTLVAAMTAATVALAGIPVHVITVNEYLVERDASAMEPLYRSLGLTVGHVVQRMTPVQRQTGYACDITYCTNKQVAFDYLRDRLLIGNRGGRLRLQIETAYTDNNRLDRLLLRGLCFAVIDEADSVLIDEARTPLILTRETRDTAEKTDYNRIMKVARRLEQEVDFFMESQSRDIQLSRIGQKKLERMFKGTKGVLGHGKQRDRLIKQALHALHLLRKDRDYLLQEGKIMIIDTNTGRIMPDRTWEHGLHQMVEAKEGCAATAIREPVGRITYQRFFRRYLRVGGMTGTAREVASELRSVYGLKVRRIPLHRPSRRLELPTRICSSGEEKRAAIINAVKQLRGQRRPILIGTGSVAESETLSLDLTVEGIPHRVLNARQDKEEADIVAAAGMPEQVTVATNIAGRGTDIPLGEGVAEVGGLHVIAACRNEARRIDRQLYGRCARQGDPGSHQAFLSLDDDLIKRNCHPKLILILKRCSARYSRLFRYLSLIILQRIQRRVECRHWRTRRALLKQEERIGQMFAFSGDME